MVKHITKLKHAEELLQLAIDSMPEGFAYYDADDRLAVVNCRMAEIYPLIADVFVPGVSFETVLRLGVERGQFGPGDGRKEEWIQDKLAYHRDPKGTADYELPDGRYIRVDETRTARGGIVGVRTDVTDLKNIARQLRNARDELEIRVEERTRELKETETRIKDIAEAATDQFWEMDENLRFTSMSDHPGRKVFPTPGAFIGRTRWEVAGGDPDKDKKWTKHRDDLLARRPFRDFEFAITDEDGVIYYRRVSGKPFFGDNGDFRGYRGSATDITDRVRTEIRIHQLAASIEDISEIFALYDADDRLIMCNKGFRDLNNAIPNAAKPGVPFEDRLRAMVEEGLVANAAGREEEWIRERLERHRIPGEPFEVVLDGGQTFLVKEQRLPGGATATIGMEITQRKRAEEVARASQARLTEIFDIAPEAVITVGEDMNIQLFNQSAERIFGYSIDEILGRNLDMLMPEHLRDGHRKHVQGFDSSEDTYRLMNQRQEIIGLRKDGTEFPAAASVSKLDLGGEKIYTVMLQDVTDRKRAEAQLIQSSKLATLGQMASGIAHELNQPLNIIRMAAESSLMRMEEGMLDAEVQKAKLGQIEGQTDRMAAIIDHMRVFAREDTRPEAIFLPTVCVENALKLIEQEYTAGGISLEKNIPDDCGSVKGSLVQLEQVILNLLSNARDAVATRAEMMVAAGVGFECKVSVALVDDEDGKSITITVTDNGGGIPDDVRAHIFDPFYTTKEEGAGTGLGLSISYKIIVQMGGWLDVYNVDGGTRFEITLPRTETLVLGKKRVRKRQEARERTDEPIHRRVLVVDDEAMAAESLAEYLERMGYEVVTAGNGVEALELFGSRPADAVITDLRMPEMDGNELIRQLREIAPNLPIFVATGHATVGDDKKVVVAEGATHVIKKPISLREIADKLVEVTKA